MDLISRQNVTDASTESNLKSHMDSVEDKQENCIDEEFIRLGETIDDEILNSYFRIRSIIMSRSSVERKGTWILIKGSNGKDYHKCSECLHTQEITGVKNYCAVCGARMVSE